MGLGLSVSRDLARFMGGDLAYCAEDGANVFEVTLLRCPPNGADGGPRSATIPVA